MKRNAVILAAGKSTRLGGSNKLLVEAGGLPVHAWHERLLDGIPTAIVTRTEEAAEVALALPWVARVIGHSAYDGPVGALAAYLDAYTDEGELLVLFADTLIAPQPRIPSGDWVGVAYAPARRWDFPTPEGWYSRGVPLVEVCVGAYSFSSIPDLTKAVEIARVEAAKAGEVDVPMTRLLNAYMTLHRIDPLHVYSWHDAGDWDAIDRVPDYRSATIDARVPRVGGNLRIAYEE